jgi:transposase-like protein
MSLDQLYKCFPNQKDCIILLEEVRWKGLPTCPYCRSKNQTSSKSQKRYHCNACNTSYSVTVGTFLGNTKLDLQKWFKAILLITGRQKEISSRELANEINVTKDTAWLMIQRVRKARTDYTEFLDGLIQAIERFNYEI